MLDRPVGEMRGTARGVARVAAHSRAAHAPEGHGLEWALSPRTDLVL